MKVLPRQAVEFLRQGEVIAYCTEGVYGLGCDPKNTVAVKKLFHMKHRSLDKSVILIGSKLEHFLEFALLDATFLEKLLQDQFIPITYVVPAKAGLVYGVVSAQGTVAIRLSQHPTVKQLCDYFANCIVSTSANHSTQPPCLTVAEVEKEFGSNLPTVEGTLTHPGHTSRVVMYDTKEIIRI